MKPALGHTPMQGHLPAFKSAAPRIASAGLLSLIARAGSLAKLRAHAAPYAHLAMPRAYRRTQIGQTRQSRSRRALTCRPVARLAVIGLAAGRLTAAAFFRRGFAAM